MFSRFLSLPGAFTWIVTVVGLLCLVAAYVAAQFVGDLARDGVETTAIVVDKRAERRQTGGQRPIRYTAYLIRYRFSVPGGKNVEAVKEYTYEEKEAWRRLEPGQKMYVRYSLKDPEFHETAFAEYTDMPSMFRAVGWLLLFLAAVLLVFDVRRNVSSLKSRYGFATTALAALAFAMAATAVVSYTIGSNWDPNVSEAYAAILDKKTVQEARLPGLAPTDKHMIEYRFADTRGQSHTFTSEVGEEFFGRTEVGRAYLVQFVTGDPASHSIESGEFKDIAPGFLAFAIAFALLALGFGLWDRRKHRKQMASARTGE